MKPPKPLAQVESEIRTSVDIRYILKRLSADNIDKMGRQIANISVHNPIVVSDLILGHIESYDNLILMIVEAFNVHMGPISLDVMGFCLLVNLGGGEKGERPGKLKGKSSLQHVFWHKYCYLIIMYLTPKLIAFLGFEIF